MMGQNQDEFSDFKPVSLECLAIYVDGRDFVPTTSDIDGVIDLLRKYSIIEGIQLVKGYKSEQEYKNKQYTKYMNNGDLLMDLIPTSDFKSYILKSTRPGDLKIDMYTMVDVNTPASLDNPSTDFDTLFYILELMFDPAESVDMAGLASRIKLDYPEFFNELEAFLGSRSTAAPKVQIGFTRS